jgi:alpha-D-ribose 1-methylphosphonate 5-triphosphate synthase subunit PhnL
MLLKNLNVPMEIWDTIHPINKSDGECVRVDISSTEIRQGLNN